MMSHCDVDPASDQRVRTKPQLSQTYIGSRDEFVICASMRRDALPDDHDGSILTRSGHLLW